MININYVTPYDKLLMKRNDWRTARGSRDSKDEFSEAQVRDGMLSYISILGLPPSGKMLSSQISFEAFKQ